MGWLMADVQTSQLQRRTPRFGNKPSRNHCSNLHLNVFREQACGGRAPTQRITQLDHVLKVTIQKQIYIYIYTSYIYMVYCIWRSSAYAEANSTRPCFLRLQHASKQKSIWSLSVSIPLGLHLSYNSKRPIWAHSWKVGCLWLHWWAALNRQLGRQRRVWDAWWPRPWSLQEGVP